MVLEQCFKQAKDNLRNLGYKEKEISEIISHLRENDDCIPYDNQGKIEFISPDDFMWGNDKALREFLGKYRQIVGANKLLVYMMLPMYSVNFECLHTFLCAIVPDNEEEYEYICEVRSCGMNQYRSAALVFNSTCWEESEYGIVLTKRTEEGLIRVG